MRSGMVKSQWVEFDGGNPCCNSFMLANECFFIINPEHAYARGL